MKRQIERDCIARALDGNQGKHHARCHASGDEAAAALAAREAVRSRRRPRRGANEPHQHHPESRCSPFVLGAFAHHGLSRPDQRFDRRLDGREHALSQVPHRRPSAAIRRRQAYRGRAPAGGRPRCRSIRTEPANRQGPRPEPWVGSATEWSASGALAIGPRGRADRRRRLRRERRRAASPQAGTRTRYHVARLQNALGFHLRWRTCAPGRRSSAASSRSPSRCRCCSAAGGCSTGCSRRSRRASPSGT